MCDPGTAILIATAVSAGSQYQSGRMQASIARRNNELMKGSIAIENAQLAEDAKIAKLNAFEEEEQRKQMVRRNIATQRAYNRGLENKSFLALIDYEQEALSKDIANLRLGGRVEQNRIATQISVNNVRSQTPDLSSFYTKSGALGAASTIAGGYADYSMTKSNPNKNTTTNSITSSYTPGGVTNVSSSGSGKTTGFKNSGYTFTG